MKLLRQLFCATIVSFVSAPMRHLLGLVILSSPVLASSQTTTPNLALNIPGSDSPDWNVLLNKNFLKLDSYLTGSATLHGVLYPASCGTSYAPSWCYGADIGAWINAAYAQLGPNGGSIYVAAGTFPWSTPLNFSNPGVCPLLTGAGRNATTLRWVGGTNATAITFNCGSFSPGGGILPGFGLRDIHFTNSVLAGSTIGLLLGGANGAYGWFGQGITVAGFDINMQYAANTWDTTCVRCNFDFPGTSNLYIPSVANTGESIQFINSDFEYSVSTRYKTTCVHNSEGDLLTFIGGSFDNCQFVQDAGTGSTVLVGVNQEDPELSTAPGATAYYGVLSSGSVRIDGGTFLQDEKNGTPPTAFWRITGGALNVSSVWPSNASSTAMLLFAVSGTGAVMFDVPSVGGWIKYPFWTNRGSGVVQGRDQLGNIVAGGVASALLNQSAAAKYSDHSACVKGKKTITLPVAYSVQPNILVFDETTKGGASLTEKSTDAFTVSCAGSSDVFDWMVVGDPN